MQTIVLIEDDSAYRTSVALILTKEGYTVLVADNGDSGIALIRENRPNLILCDIMMPGSDGHWVLEQLKSDRSIADIPFIFVSALDDRTDVRSGMAKGADDYLTKPFTAEELLAAVAGRLQRVELLRQPRETPATQEEFNRLRQRISDRELEVLLLVGKGFPSKEIATRLGIRINTVHVHRANLLRKLEANNAANLSYWAFVAESMLEDTLKR